MGISYIDEMICNGCKTCVDSCPMDVIGFDEEKDKAVILYGDDCHTCYLCDMDCPVEAIEVSPEITREVILPY